MGTLNQAINLILAALAVVWLLNRFFGSDDDAPALDISGLPFAISGPRLRVTVRETSGVALVHEFSVDPRRITRKLIDGGVMIYSSERWRWTLPGGSATRYELERTDLLGLSAEPHPCGTGKPEGPLYGGCRLHFYFEWPKPMLTLRFTP